jgi:hypothetical protein
MSFSPETEKLVNELIQTEYKNACEKFGEKYHSLHEGHAVLKEEIEEVRKEIKHLKMDKKVFWNIIKENEIAGMKQMLIFLKEDVESSIKELSQVGAVLMKMQNTIVEVEE